MADGRLLWRTQLPQLWRYSVLVGEVAASGGVLYMQHPDGRIAVLDAADGHLLTVLRPPWPGGEAGNLLVGGGMVFETVYRNSTLYAPPGSGVVDRGPILLAFGTD